LHGQPQGRERQKTRFALGGCGPSCAPSRKSVPTDAEANGATPHNVLDSGSCQPEPAHLIGSDVQGAPVDPTKLLQSGAACTAAAAIPDFSSYKVVRMDASLSRHPRAALEAAVLQIADDIREKPTVPADPEDAEEPWRLALRDDLALHLPSKHCAFRGCDWTGNDDASLYAHVAEEHSESMARGAERFSLAFSVEERMEAVYNEAVAEK
jgi:hypothetical protein